MLLLKEYELLDTHFQSWMHFEKKWNPLKCYDFVLCALQKLFVTFLTLSTSFRLRKCFTLMTKATQRNNHVALHGSQMSKAKKLFRIMDLSNHDFFRFDTKFSTFQILNFFSKLCKSSSKVRTWISALQLKFVANAFEKGLGLTWWPIQWTRTLKKHKI